MGMMFDLETILEDIECECGCIGVEGNGADRYICPNCGKEGSIYEEFDSDWD